VKQVYDFVRGLSPYPAARAEFTFPNGEEAEVKVFEVKGTKEPHSDPVGTLQTDRKSYLRVPVPDGYIYIHTLQLPGKKKMTISEWLRGADKYFS
jgi:methionyl-tRNA formyltransferase